MLANHLSRSSTASLQSLPSKKHTFLTSRHPPICFQSPPTNFSSHACIVIMQQLHFSCMEDVLEVNLAVVTLQSTPKDLGNGKNGERASRSGLLLSRRGTHVGEAWAWWRAAKPRSCLWLHPPPSLEPRRWALPTLEVGVIWRGRHLPTAPCFPLETIIKFGSCSCYVGSAGTRDVCL